MKKISFIITAFNEEDNVVELHKQINDVTKSINNYEFEIVFIENGSTDKTFMNLKNIQNYDKKVKIIKLSRNFGFDGGITAGLDRVDTDAAIIMTANLQDDPAVVPKFIDKWEEGFDMVYGIVTNRPGKSLLRKINSSVFYSLIKLLTNGMIPKDVSDYRLVDKKVISALRELKEANRFYRGFFSWVGFNTIGVEFERQQRFSGISKATTSTQISFATRGLFAFSNFPLRLSILFTILCSVSAITLLSIQTYRWFTLGVPFDGFGTIVGLFLLFFSFLFAILSVLGQYIGMIFEETKSRPIYIIDEEF